MIDLAHLAKVIANLLGAVAILAVVIFAAVAYLKQWGLTGRWLTGSAFAVGVVIAVGVRIAMSPLIHPSDWIWAAVLGLMAGALATGAYKGAENVTGKTAVAELLGGLQVDYDPEPAGLTPPLNGKS